MECPAPVKKCNRAHTVGRLQRGRRGSGRLARLSAAGGNVSFKQMAEPCETPEEFGRRIADLYRQMSYPGASRFRAALGKRGIKVSEAFVKELVADQGARQLFAPPPRFTVHVTARHVDERRAADVMDLQSSLHERLCLPIGDSRHHDSLFICTSSSE